MDTRDRLIEILQDLILELDEEEYCEETWKERAADTLLGAGCVLPKFKVGDTAYFYSKSMGVNSFIVCRRKHTPSSTGESCYWFYGYKTRNSGRIYYIREDDLYTSEAEVREALTKL